MRLAAALLLLTLVAPSADAKYIPLPLHDMLGSSDLVLVGTIAELSNVLGGSVKSLIDAETALDVPQAQALPTDALTPLTAVSVFHALGTFDVHLGN